MSGLVKPKKYDWKDSNLAMFGSDTEKEVKKEAAESEPAWEGAGQEEGLQIWRIVNFEVTSWPKEDYGKFYSGDSYIVLNTYKPDPDADKLAWDIHFWIGKYSSQDEYGTAAYKTVELDCYLDDMATQHREVQDHESEEFLELFPHLFEIMKGGADSGFRHVEPETYEPRLLHFSGMKKNIVVKEVPLIREKMISDDVYILDNGMKLYQWNGSGCNKDERFKAMQFLNELKSERGNAESEVVDEGDEPSEFNDAFPADVEDDDDDDDEQMSAFSDETKNLYRVSDDSGDLTFSLVKEGDVSLDDFVSSDVFVLDTGKMAYVWVGSDASAGEKKNGLAYAHKKLMETNHPVIPITVVKEGSHSRSFMNAIAA